MTPKKKGLLLINLLSSNAISLVKLNKAVSPLFIIQYTHTVAKVEHKLQWITSRDKDPANLHSIIRTGSVGQESPVHPACIWLIKEASMSSISEEGRSTSEQAKLVGCLLFNKSTNLVGRAGTCGDSSPSRM